MFSFVLTCFSQLYNFGFSFNVTGIPPQVHYCPEDETLHVMINKLKYLEESLAREGLRLRWEYYSGENISIFFLV